MDYVCSSKFSNNSRRDITRTLFGLGFFAFPNSSLKTTSSVKTSKTEVLQTPSAMEVNLGFGRESF